MQRSLVQQTQTALQMKLHCFCISRRRGPGEASRPREAHRSSCAGRRVRAGAAAAGLALCQPGVCQRGAAARAVAAYVGPGRPPRDAGRPLLPPRCPFFYTPAHTHPAKPLTALHAAPKPCTRDLMETKVTRSSPLKGHDVALATLWTALICSPVLNPCGPCRRQHQAGGGHGRGPANHLQQCGPGGRVL